MAPAHHPGERTAVEPGTTEAPAVWTTGGASSGQLLAQRPGLRPLVTVNLTVASHLLGRLTSRICVVPFS